MTEKIVIIDYGSGNLRSVEKSIDRAARNTGGAFSVSISANPEEIGLADRLVLPGVGAFASCMHGLTARPGVLEALEHAVILSGRPFLGICVGMQLLAVTGEEMGEHYGLGWIDGLVQLHAPDDRTLRRPHMGWNSVAIKTNHPVLANVNGAAFYFAHSYCFEAENRAHVVATCEYGQSFAAAIARDNLFGVQFHPEKSQNAGIALITNFLKWRP